MNWGNRPDRPTSRPTPAPLQGQRRWHGPRRRAAGHRPPVLQKDSWSAQVVDELPQAPADIRVDKHRISGFWDTPLDSILRNLRVDTLLFAGVNLDQCVLHSLTDANFLGFDTLLVEDCAATTNPGFCRDATILNIHQIFGFTLSSTDLMESIRP